MSQYLGDISAYALAVSQGYTGTEEEYAELMASYATVGQTAVTAAQTATTKASEAATSATTATNKASEATTAATTATNKAAEAQADADAAALDASQALSAASTATSKATEATTAAATATSAASTATTAKDDAVSAKTAAQTAQTGAETAAASVQSSAEQITQNTSDISELKEDFATMESDGVVPSAEQILTDKGVTDCVPYHYRKTGGNGADREYVDAIVGGTVNYTQHVVNRADMFAGYNAQFVFNDGTITVTPSGAPSRVYQSIKTIKGHKYIVLATFKGTIGEALISWYGALAKATSMSGSWQIVANLIDNTYDSNDAWQVYFGCANNAELAEYQVKDMQCFDLTAMFGSTIADYIYQLEQATAGAGVAFFKALFPNDYYPYNAGELVSVSGVSAHAMRDADDNIIRSYPLDSSLTLRGLFKLDANNNLYADGDTYEYTGKVTRNTILRAYQSGDESLANAITDGTNTVVYSANASTEEADPYQHLQQCDPNGTEEYVSTGIVPVGHNSFYPENLRAKVEQLPWNFANLIAPTESTYTATRNYTTGALFIVQNVLYKATSNIANGGSITPNTNCTATTLAEIISALA